jgi:phytanoyl-CoA hydroxylase
LAGIRHPWNTSFEWARAVTDPQLLTCDEVARFHEDGFIVVDELIDDDTIAALTAELDPIDELTDTFLRTRPDDRMMIAESGAITFTPHVCLRSDAARSVSRHPTIAAICRDLIGSDVRLYWDQIVYKSPEKPRRFPWHQDNGYTFVLPQQYVTVWLALTDATVEAGCPWVAPGAHLYGTLHHEYVEPLGYECFTEFPGAVATPVRAGDAVVFSSLTPHLTGPNLTDAVRKTYILQYAPDGAMVLEGNPTAGGPTGETPQDDITRQYPVVQGGVLHA